jgi:hypothetical protein
VLDNSTDDPGKYPSKFLHLSAPQYSDPLKGRNSRISKIIKQYTAECLIYLIEQQWPEENNLFLKVERVLESVALISLGSIE